jgi:peptide/nickel transport system permease protein
VISTSSGLQKSGGEAKTKLDSEIQARGTFAEAWSRLRRRPVAMLSLTGVVLVCFVAVFGDLIADYDKMALAQHANEKYLSFSARHIMGTDRFGRDTFARIVHGARTDLFLGVGATIISMSVSVLLASVSALKGGTVDNVIMRVIDILGSIPALVIALAICAGLGRGIMPLLVALSIQAIPYQTKMIRSNALTVAQMEYIEAARALGANSMHVALRHLIPNIASIIIIVSTANVSYNILMGATLSFIGIGIEAPRPEWGMMLSESLNSMTRYPLLVILPGCAIVLTALCINTLGDSLRDALDPKLKGKA